MKRYLRMILNIVIPFLGLCLVIFLGPRLLRFFMPFVVGWILALLANPLVRFLERRVKLVRRHGSMLIIIAALAIVIGLFYGAGLLVYREMGSFLADAPEIYQSVIAEIGDALQNGRKLAEYFPQNLQPPLLAFSDNLDGLFGKLVSRAAEPTVPDRRTCGEEYSESSGKYGHYYPVFISVSGGSGVHHAVAERASSGIYIPLYRVYETGRKGSDWRIFSGTIPYHVCGGADSRGRIFGAGCPLRCPVGIFDGDSGFSADLWNWNGAVPMGGCEAVRGGVCVCDRTYPALHPDAGRPSDHPAEDRRGVDGIAASDDPVSFVSGI